MSTNLASFFFHMCKYVNSNILIDSSFDHVKPFSVGSHTITTDTPEELL